MSKKKKPSDKTIISVKALPGNIQELSIEAQSVEKAYGLWMVLSKELGLKNGDNS